jgi:tetratricopeptide (TPR) repeat protein
MVHVARGHLREAETVLRQGAAVQDRQVARGDRYPALGLHWLLGLVRLADADFDEALQEFEREEARADPHRLYGREYAMAAVHARGACLLRAGRHADAIACFERALALNPDHAQSHIGLVLAFRATDSSDRAQDASARLAPILKTLTDARPIEAALVESQMLVMEGQPDAACAVLCRCLEAAPPGFAGWTIPVEPLLVQLHGTQAFAATLAQLAERAR